MRSNVFGAFTFNAGTDGFVEIHTANSTGLVIADAVEFSRVPQSHTLEGMSKSLGKPVRQRDTIDR